MRNAIKAAVVGAVSSLALVSFAGTASAADSENGYRECQGSVVVFSTTTGSGAFSVGHSLLSGGRFYDGGSWSTPGFHAQAINRAAGEWSVSTTGNISSAGSSCTF